MIFRLFAGDTFYVKFPHPGIFHVRQRHWSHTFDILAQYQIQSSDLILMIG